MTTERTDALDFARRLAAKARADSLRFVTPSIAANLAGIGGTDRERQAEARALLHRLTAPDLGYFRLVLTVVGDDDAFVELDDASAIAYASGEGEIIHPETGDAVAAVDVSSHFRAAERLDELRPADPQPYRFEVDLSMHAADRVGIVGVYLGGGPGRGTHLGQTDAPVPEADGRRAMLLHVADRLIATAEAMRAAARGDA